MSLDSSEIWTRIGASGLAAPMQCRTWAAEVDNGLSPADAANGLKVLQYLIALKHLTKYQAKILAGQSDQPLRIGNWRVLTQRKEPLWRGWAEVAGGLGTPDAHTRCWARWLDDRQLSQLSECGPGLPRTLRLSQIEHPCLLKVYAPELVDGKILLRVASPETDGGVLTEQTTSGGRLETGVVTELIKQLVDVVATLHQRQLVHGRLLPDRILWNSKDLMLLVDPLCGVTTTANPQQHGLVGSQLDRLHPVQFIAPELLARERSPWGLAGTSASDVYALGSLWWWLLTGAPPIQADSVSEMLAGHNQRLPELPDACGLSQPLKRCLQHCLAYNPSARFASAVELSVALAAAQKITERVDRQPVTAASTPTETIGRMVDVSAKPVNVPARAQEHAAEADDAQQPVVAAAAKAAPQVALGSASAKLEQASGERAARKLAARPRTAPTTRMRRRRSGNRWLIPVVGGCGFVIVLLLVLKFSGALQPSLATNDAESPKADYVPKPTQTQPVDLDPRLEYYSIVEANSANAITPWAPPAPPSPIPLDLLPPGGQLFLSIRVDALLAIPSARALIAAMDDQLSPLLASISDRAGQPLESMGQVTIAFYPAANSGELPLSCLRISLLSPQSLQSLQRGWAETREETVGPRILLVSDDERAFYVPNQPLVGASSVNAFSLGPLDLMRDVAESSGAAGPLTSPMEQLWRVSDQTSEVSLLSSPAFLLTEGRELLARGPTPLAESLKELVGDDMRAALVQTHFDPSWYLETQLVGGSDRDAGRIVSSLEDKIRGGAARVEQWFVRQSPHPYWRGLALRYPQMLRTMASQTRYGVENGVAIANAYLPREAANNLILGTWIATQENAVLVTELSTVDTPAPVQPLSIEEYLARPIRLSFDQEPIEVALRLVEDEANDRLPEGTPKLRFLLDGDAFEKAGITRNQQLRDFQHDNLPVRVALTEIAKRGNPVTTVTDTRQPDQKLVWAVAPDPQSPGDMAILLTTRTAASTSQTALPAEFAN